MYDSEVMCRKKVDIPWSIYRDFTVIAMTITNSNSNYNKTEKNQLLQAITFIKRYTNYVTTNHSFKLILN